MASPPNFLSLPLEIRYQIYSHFLINSSVVNVLDKLMISPLRNGVMRACRQTFSEMIVYYYANNTFLYSLVSQPRTRPALRQRLNNVQHLQVEVGDLEFSSTHRAFSLPVHTQQRCDWFLKALYRAKKRRQARRLKSLVAIDRCGTSIVSE